ncbi:acyl-CoA transferase [Defluviimonas sp. WL0002]|uniref:Acyl-CoA transferase n=1 Tax=Albidovulum marisflavi TaxID=2984159 RepID=A0ABT2ZHY5_9RHOB|nr:acyl-CoA transferase [Defluviimonas sp. WL0002]MCV2870637.1 acyl-CoA transferase [Defluviimonas sp. WL0002]
MATKRETALAALHAALQLGLGGLAIGIERGAPVPTEISADGLVILRDGQPGEPEVTMSPLAYHYEHRAEIEIYAQDADDDARATAFDDLVAAVGAVIAANRTLGGAVLWAEAEAPEPQDLPVTGGAAIKAATIAVVLHYSTSDPLV